MAEQDHTLESLKVLLVDDSVQTLELIRNMLTDMGVSQIYTAKDGVEATKYMDVLNGSEGVDVILCDWYMPKISGIEFLKQIRDRDPDLAFFDGHGQGGPRRDHRSIVSRRHRLSQKTFFARRS